MIKPNLLEDWNKLIFEKIVASGNPEKPLYLYIDSETLGEIAKLESNVAQEAFTKSFLEHYRIGEGETPFENAVFEALNWPKTVAYGGLENPKILPLLALCVLAVTDKSASPGQSVYFLLNKFLCNKETTGKPNGYELMPEVWEIWNKWLKTVGKEYGKPTARVIDHYALQGFARSQGFIRRRERVFITDFFSDYNMLPGAKFQEEYLISLFETWLRGQGKKGFALYEKIFESGEIVTRKIFSEILLNELESWNGLTQTESGGDSLFGYLARDSYGTNWEVICPVQKRLFGTKIDLGNGEVTVDENWPLIFVSQINGKEIKEEELEKVDDYIVIKRTSRNRMV